MIMETEYLSRNAEYVQLDREFQQKFLRYQQVRRKPGMFTAWWQFGLFCIFTGAMWGFVIWGGKILLEMLRGR
jgi:hypothetical protein